MSWDGEWWRPMMMQIVTFLFPLQWLAVSRISGLPASDGGQGGIRGAVQGLPALLDTHGAVVAHLLVVLRADTQNDWRLQLLSPFSNEQWERERGKRKRKREGELKMQSILRQENRERRR